MKKVYLNVYDLNRDCNQGCADMIGFGVYHSGVQIDNTEYAFAGSTVQRGTGVYETRP